MSRIQGIPLIATLILLCISCSFVQSFVPVTPLQSRSSSKNKADTMLYAFTEAEATANQDQDDAKNEDDDDDDEEIPVINQKGRTLYDTLQADPKATKAELKRQYVQMARQTHPDALIGREIDENAVDFVEVADAWRILSDAKERRRYDRRLQAEAFADNVGELASKVSETAGPPVRKIFEDLAVPFLRRTAVTSIASFTAVADTIAKGEGGRGGVNGTKEVDLARAISMGFRAGQAAGRIIDGEELATKADELQARAENELERAMEIHKELTDVTDKRLNLALQTPNSALSAAEAMKLLDGLNTIDSVSVREMIRLKHTIKHEIDQLEDIETDYYQKVNEQKQAEQQLKKNKAELQKTEVVARKAIAAQDAAQKALDEAKKKVVATTQSLMELKRAQPSKEHQFEKTTSDLERVSSNLEQRQEKVRQALIEKKEIVDQENKRHGATEEVDQQQQSSSEKLVGMSLEELQKLENTLTKKTSRIEETAAKLQSRAQKLIARADELSVLRKKQQAEAATRESKDMTPPPSEETAPEQRPKKSSADSGRGFQKES